VLSLLVLVALNVSVEVPVVEMQEMRMLAAGVDRNPDGDMKLIDVGVQVDRALAITVVPSHSLQLPFAVAVPSTNVTVPLASHVPVVP
jgi:hypothetical protein